jgi:hypothetical protein
MMTAPVGSFASFSHGVILPDPQPADGQSPTYPQMFKRAQRSRVPYREGGGMNLVGLEFYVETVR